MKKEDENKSRGRKKINAGRPLGAGFSWRFTCGNGPDEEPDGFQNAVRGLRNKGHLETEAKKIAESCFRALAKF